MQAPIDMGGFEGICDMDGMCVMDGAVVGGTVGIAECIVECGMVRLAVGAIVTDGSDFFVVAM